MVHPPVDRNGVEATAGESSRSIPTPFLTKTYQLVDDPALDDIISWNEDGSAFVVRNPTDFARDLLPKYFKHNNFSSFVRQLNTYGFRKIVSDRWEFSNECFRKDEKSLLGDIHRRRVGAAAVLLPTTPVPVPMVVAVVPEEVPIPRHSVSGTDSGEDQVISSTYSPGVVLREGAVSGGVSGSGSTVDLIGENDRLRKDNLQLNKELCHMKSMCNNIYSLMSNYSNNCDNSSKVSESVDNQIPMEALDLMPAGQYCTEADETNTGGMVVDERNAKLFGVSIGMKRRMEEEEEEGEEDTDGVAEHSKVVEIKQREKMIKIEVLDDDEDDDYNNDNQKSPCVTRNKQNRSFRPDFYS